MPLCPPVGEELASVGEETRLAQRAGKERGKEGRYLLPDMLLLLLLLKLELELLELLEVLLLLELLLQEGGASFQSLLGLQYMCAKGLSARCKLLLLGSGGAVVGGGLRGRSAEGGCEAISGAESVGTIGVTRRSEGRQLLHELVVEVGAAATAYGRHPHAAEPGERSPPEAHLAGDIQCAGGMTGLLWSCHGASVRAGNDENNPETTVGRGSEKLVLHWRKGDRGADFSGTIATRT